MAFRLVYFVVIVFINFNYLYAETEDFNETNVSHILSPDSGIDFTFNIYRQLESKKNLFFSPISIRTILTLVMQGTKGQSQIEMLNVLQYGPELSMDVINSGMNKSIIIMNERSGNCVLNLANKVYIQKKLSIKKTFRQIVEKYYQGELRAVDFKHNLENSRQQINKWVSKKTKGKITELFTFLEDSTLIVLVNAIYFSGTWHTKFPKKSIVEAFYIGHGSQVKVKMMELSKMLFKYAEDKSLKCKILELPYQDKIFSMFIILPNEIDGLGELERELNANKLKTLQSNMYGKTINKLKLPKFKLSEEYNMIPVFSKLGMGTIFNNRADFSGITTKIPLKISKLVHRAIIEVNEHGSEAAAATSIAISARMHTDKSANNFIADHPFMFMIWNKRIENIVFIGRVQNPAEP